MRSVYGMWCRDWCSGLSVGIGVWDQCRDACMGWV